MMDYNPVTGRLKVIAFDVFGTVVNFTAPYEERKAYADHIAMLDWSPLVLPESWEHFKPHSDSVEGINRLRAKYFVTTCSNGPLGMIARLSKNAGLHWDMILPLELNKVFKPRPRAYMVICEVLGVTPDQVMMVTANKDFGDLESASALGMSTCLIRRGGTRNPEELIDIIKLAEMLGC